MGHPVLSTRILLRYRTFKKKQAKQEQPHYGKVSSESPSSQPGGLPNRKRSNQVDVLDKIVEMSELEDEEEELSYEQATFRGEEDLEEGLDEAEENDEVELDGGRLSVRVDVHEDEERDGIRDSFFSCRSNPDQ